MEIRFIPFNDLSEKITELCQTISAIYGLESAKFAFISSFANVAKKHFASLTIDQLTEAFELNAVGKLNADCKVKFTIPDIIKVLKAYQATKHIDEPETKPEPSNEEKQAILDTWKDLVCGIFDRYARTGKKEMINIPLYYCHVFHRIGILDLRKVDLKEKRFNLKLGKNQRSSTNQDLIFKVFDELISRGQHISTYLRKLAINDNFGKNEMPF
jgi:hypothetical protein